jgi:plasmid stabilization system protein ParE
MQDDFGGLKVVIAPLAAADLKEIYLYNYFHWSPAQADRYESFLLESIRELSTDYSQGRRVNGFPALKSLRLRFSRRRDGHLLIFEVSLASRTISVVRIFHTRMDLGRPLSEQVDDPNSESDK